MPNAGGSLADVFLNYAIVSSIEHLIGGQCEDPHFPDQFASLREYVEYWQLFEGRFMILGGLNPGKRGNGWYITVLAHAYSYLQQNICAESNSPPFWGASDSTSLKGITDLFSFSRKPQIELAVGFEFLRISKCLSCVSSTE
jgi:hypothetical protein